MAVQGVGSLLVVDVLSDVSLALIEPLVNTAIPAGGIVAGVQTVNAWDPSLYVGALVVVGIAGGDIEVVTVTATVPGTSFTATFANAHPAGDPVYGPTFPVQSSTGDVFFTQAEMLQYISDAVNDYLIRVPLVYAVTDAISVGPTQPTTALPADCMTPVRVAAFGTGLRESSQSWLDSVTPRWQQLAASGPLAYYRDKIGLQKIGVMPVSNNMLPLEIIYQQRSAQTLGLADGFLLPDPFLVYIKARVLEFAYSKNGEERSPAMARYWSGRYETGVKIGSMILDAAMDPNEQ